MRASLQGTSAQPVCPAHRGDLSGGFSSARRPSCQSHCPVRLAVFPRSCLLPPLPPAPPADTLLSCFSPAPALRLPLHRRPASSRLPPAPTGGPSASAP